MRKWIVALAPIVACSSSTFEETTTAPAETDDAPNAAAGEGAATAPVAGDAGTRGGDPDGGSAADAAPPPPAPATVVTNETVQVWGKARTFVLVAPRAVVPSKAYPLVFVFHGDGGTGAAMRGAVNVDEVTGADAIVVYPDGKNATWDLYTPQAANEDNAFVDVILSAVEAKYLVDETRIFGSGYSSGAFFINQIACRRSGFFRAIAPNAGGAPAEPNDPAASTWPGTSFTRCANQTTGVAAIIMHGSDDYVVGPGSGTHDAKYWAYVNGCDATESGRTPTTPSPCVQHASCPTDKRVVYCEIPGIGHGIWGESAKATWSFFAAQ
jgi:polyhydroxybutyrate depolymerase